MNTKQELNGLEQTASKLATWSARIAERELVKALIAIEGELPDQSVIAEHSERNHEKVGGVNFDYYWWGGEHILSISQVHFPEAVGGVIEPWVQVDRVYEEKHGVADVSEYIIQQ